LGVGTRSGAGSQEQVNEGSRSRQRASINTMLAK
jgi:hypothetical protein